MSAQSDGHTTQLAHTQPQTLYATITLQELSGVKCNTGNRLKLAKGKGTPKIKGLPKRLSSRLGGQTSSSYADVGSDDKNKDAPSPLSAKAVVWFRHTGDSGRNLTVSSHLPSLSMSDESRDEDGSLILHCAWPEEKHDSVKTISALDDMNLHINAARSSVHLCREVAADDSMIVPALVSLRVGLIFPGEQEVKPLGVATVMIPAKETELNLLIPLDPDLGERLAVKPKKGLSRLGISARKLFQNEYSQEYYVTSSTVLSIKLVVDDKPVAHTIAANGISSSPSCSSASLKFEEKREKSLMKQLLSYRDAAMTDQGKKISAQGDEDDVRSHTTPQVIILDAPSQDTDTVLNGTRCSRQAVEQSDVDECQNLSYLADLPLTKGTSSAKSVGTDATSNCSVSPSETTPTSTDDSTDNMRNIVISPSDNRFHSQGIHTQLANIVITSNENEAAPSAEITTDNSVPTMEQVIPSGKAIEILPTKNPVDPFNEEAPSHPNISLDTSVKTGMGSMSLFKSSLNKGDEALETESSEIFTLEDKKSGMVHQIEISVEGSNSSINKCELKSDSSKNRREARIIDSKNIASLFEGDFIELNQTMSDIGDLTVDFDDAASSSIMSRSIKVAMNSQHPQRKDALGLLRRLAGCNDNCAGVFNIDEVMDDVVGGLHDIMDSADGGDRFCDGEGNSFTDDDSFKSGCMSLNTVDETTLDESFHAHRTVSGEVSF